MSQQIFVASNNPVKLQAVRAAFESVFPQKVFFYNTCQVPSDVSDQPASDDETLAGALNRCSAAQKKYPQAAYWVGIEGGVQESEIGLLAFAWVVVRSPGLIGKGRTGTFVLPPAVAELIQQGYELGTADDIIFGRVNSKQEEGAIGILTGGILDRQKLYETGVLLALIPFIKPDLYT